jgi:hypothetical protein
LENEKENSDFNAEWWTDLKRVEALEKVKLAAKGRGFPEMKFYKSTKSG